MLGFAGLEVFRDREELETTVDVERAEVSQRSAVFGEKHRRDREDA